MLLVHWFGVPLWINLPPCLEALQAIWNGATNSDLPNFKSQKDLTAMILIILLITHEECMTINP